MRGYRARDDPAFLLLLCLFMSGKGQTVTETITTGFTFALHYSVCHWLWAVAAAANKWCSLWMGMDCDGGLFGNWCVNGSGYVVSVPCVDLSS